MFPRPHADLQPNTAEFENLPLVQPTGFREYDARWWFGHAGSDRKPDLNLMGVQAVGLGLGTLARSRGARPDIVVGHDYRSYSAAIKMALMTGLMASGMKVHDIGLAVTPMAYFAQFELDVPCVAMITASHNDNGWTGVKMGFERPVTFGPEDMAELRDIVLSGEFKMSEGGAYEFHGDMAERYIRDLTNRDRISRKLKVVVACGNGTASVFAPRVLEALGCEVIPLNTTLDHSFPNYNPNPEDMQMLHAMTEAVSATGADMALGFDGDGDRCGVVDNEGAEIFSDKIGVMLARDFARLHRGARFVVDVKSTGLFSSDPELARLGAKTTYWKTGHSHIKRHVQKLNALAGFEKSGHFFFNAPLGRGYDDGLVSAIAIIGMMDRNPDHSMSDLYRALPKTWGSPTMSPYCADEVKYGVVDRLVRDFQLKKEQGEMAGGMPITGLITVNGVRVVTSDGTWGLVRASSNKPELVVVVESPVSESRMREMFDVMDGAIRKHPEVGAYNQMLPPAG